MSDAIVVLCTCPDSGVAKELARGLVDARLAACVNVLPEIRSIYRWEDELQEDSEVLMVIKSTKAGYSGLERWLLDRHPYDVPEVLALPVAHGAEAYLAWMMKETEAR